MWRRVRDWAVDGQNATLARLGVGFERILYDSDRTQTSREVAQLGIERGVFVREPRGTIAYMTGDDNYPVMPLTRADGFPTHHLRVVAMWRDMMLGEPEDTDLIHLSGDEWKAHVIYTEELLARLEPGVRVLPSLHIVHGMVSSEVDGELSSSKGTAQLVDELLDELAGRPEVRARAREGEPLMAADDLVAIAVLGFCLDKPVHKGLAMPLGRALPRPGPQHRLADRARVGEGVGRRQRRCCRTRLRTTPPTATSCCSRSCIAATSQSRWRISTCSSTCAMSATSAAGISTTSTTRAWGV